MKAKTRFVVVALALMVGCAGAWARGGHGGHGGARFGVGVYVGGPWWGGWWGPSYYYNPPLVIQQPVVQTPTIMQTAPAANYWYFCRSANAYYPYVKDCPSGWEQVTPTPPAQ
jgi:hypothetical protein